MKKPEQAKKLCRNPFNDDLLESIEGAMSSIADAMDYLKGYAVFAEWFDVLGDIYDEMKPDHEQYESVAAAEYEAEIEALTRDYYRSVI